MIPYGRQDIDQQDIDAVVATLRSDWLTQGPAVPRFETLLCERFRSRHAVAVSSATAALHLSCLALGLAPGDYLWTSPISFVASANCARYCGAEVDFVDVEPSTGNLCIAALQTKLETAEREGRLPKVVVPVHLGGLSCDMTAIKALADQYDFSVIEDASHAVGSEHLGDPVGNCRHSDITVFSFHPVKIITTGEGGVALTNDKTLASRMSRLREHGITREPAEMTHSPDGDWYYQQLELGFNYRMTDIQAALGASQLQRLEHFLSRRRELAEFYDDYLKDIPVHCPVWRNDVSLSSLHLYAIRLQLDRIATTHTDAFTALRSRGIGVGLHYIPIYLQPYYRALGFESRHCPNAEVYYGEAITLPLFPLLTASQQKEVVREICDIAK